MSGQSRSCYFSKGKRYQHFYFLEGDDLDDIVGGASTVFSVLATIAALTVALVYLAIWDFHSGDLILIGVIAALNAFSVWPHEAMHYLGFRAAGVPPSALRINLSPPMFCRWAGWCEWRGEVSLAGWRFAGIAPFVCLGVLPIVLGLATGNWWLTCWGALELLGCRVDFELLWKSRGFRDDVAMLYAIDPSIPWSKYVKKGAQQGADAR